MKEAEQNFTTRRRVIVIQMLYALHSTTNDIAGLDPRILNRTIQGVLSTSTYKPKDNNREDVDVAMEVISNLESIDSLIKEHCSDISRVSMVVLAILRTGIYEIQYCSNKHKIGNVIKDYLNIAVAMSHDADTGFINSILDKAVSKEENTATA